MKETCDKCGKAVIHLQLMGNQYMCLTCYYIAEEKALKEAEWQKEREDHR